MSKPAIDFASPTWHAIQTLAAQKVTQLREQNDSPALDAVVKLNPGNVNAWLKHNDSSKMSLDCARQIYKYAKSYPSVR